VTTLAAPIGLDDLGLLLFFVVAALARFVKWLRDRHKRSQEERQGEPGEDEASAPLPPGPPPLPHPPPHAPDHDPWRRTPSPSPSRAPRPAQATHSLVDARAPAPPKGERWEKGKKHAAQAEAVAPPPLLRGRALLLGNHKSVQDRIRSAMAWREVLSAPRLLRPPRANASARARDRAAR
jgi:hypothetical protein